MATIEELVIQIAAENKELKSVLASSVTATANATKQMSTLTKQFSDSSTKSVSGFQQAMATMAGFVGGAAIIGAFNRLKDAIFGAFSTGIDAANAQEDALARLAVALGSTGRATEASLDSFGAFADSMETLTNVGDDVVLSQAAVLAGMTRLSNEGIQNAISAANDLSVAMGIGLEQAVMLVGKAANGQTDAFKKMGIEISETGGKAAVFERTMGVLNERFGGAAAAKAETFSGAIEKVKNSFGNFAEEVATAITQNEVVIAVFSKVAQIFGELQKGVAANKKELKEMIAVGVISAIEAFKLLINITDGLLRTLRAAVTAILGVGQAFVDTFQAVSELVTGGGLKKAGEQFAETASAFQLAGAAFSEETFLGNVAGKLDVIGDAAASAMLKMEEGSDKAGPKLKNVAKVVTEVSDEVKAFQAAQAEFAKGVADQGNSFDALYNHQIEGAKLAYEEQLAMDASKLEATQAYYDSLLQIQAQQFTDEQDALLAARQNGLITEQEFAAAKTELAKQQSEEERKLALEKNKSLADVNKQRTEDLKSTFGVIAGLSESSNKELAAIGKAAAIANATIDGYAAVQKALASAPPPFNFALAAAVGVATAANVAKIAGTPLAGGIDSVPRSAGGGNLGDNFPAILKPGERVVPAETNQDLTNFLARAGNGPQSVQININIQNSLPASREAGALMIEAIQEALDSGSLQLRLS